MNGYFNIYELIPGDLSLNDNTEIMVNDAYGIIERYFNLNKVPYFGTNSVRASGSISKNDTGYAISMLLENKQLTIEVAKDTPNVVSCKISAGGSSGSDSIIERVPDDLMSALSNAYSETRSEYPNAHAVFTEMYNSDKLYLVHLLGGETNNDCKCVVSMENFDGEIRMVTPFGILYTDEPLGDSIHYYIT